MFLNYKSYMQHINEEVIHEIELMAKVTKDLSEFKYDLNVGPYLIAIGQTAQPCSEARCIYHAC